MKAKQSSCLYYINGWGKMRIDGEKMWMDGTKLEQTNMVNKNTTNQSELSLPLLSRRLRTFFLCESFLLFRFFCSSSSELLVFCRLCLTFKGFDCFLRSSSSSEDESSDVAGFFFSRDFDFTWKNAQGIGHIAWWLTIFLRLSWACDSWCDDLSFIIFSYVEICIPTT